MHHDTENHLRSLSRESQWDFYRQLYTAYCINVTANTEAASDQEIQLRGAREVFTKLTPADFLVIEAEVPRTLACIRQELDEVMADMRQVEPSSLQ